MDAQFALANMLYKQQGCEEYENVVKEEMMKFWLSKIYYQNTNIVGETNKLAFEMLSFIYGVNYEDYLPIPMGKQPFNNGLMCVFDWKKKKTGYIDISGKKVIPLEYESFHCFSEGLVNVLKDKKYGFLNNKNKTIIPFIYDLAYPFYNGSAVVMQKEIVDNQLYKRYFLINKEGKRISEIYDYMSHSIGNQLILASRGDKFGFVDRDGKLRVPFVYENARSCNPYETAWDDYKYCAVCKNGYWGFVDTSTFNGEIVVPLIYRKVRDFHYGLAAVYKDLYWHFINNKGDMQSERYADCQDFQSNGLAVVKKEKDADRAYLINKPKSVIRISRCCMAVRNPLVFPI